MVAIMLGQTDRDGIPAALPSGTPVANKTGEIEGTRNDVAIVEPYGDSPFILAVMTADAYDYRGRLCCDSRGHASNLLGGIEDLRLVACYRLRDRASVRWIVQP